MVNKRTFMNNMNLNCLQSGEQKRSKSRNEIIIAIFAIQFYMKPLAVLKYVLSIFVHL